MKFSTFIRYGCVAVIVMGLPAAGMAAEVHTITPHFPDAFKLRTTAISDMAQTAQGQTTTSHTVMVASGAVARQGSGYHGTYHIDSFDLTSQGPDGKPSPQEAAQRNIMDTLKSVGDAEVTFDGNLDPVKVDNIEDLKAKIKAQFALATDPAQVKGNQMIYDMMIGNLTPESAAAFMRQSKQAVNYFNVPLTLGERVKVDAAPMEVMGASLRTNTSMTLTGWDEGKQAHLHYVMAPTTEDMHGFLAGVLHAVFGKMAEAQDPQTKAMLDRMIDNMQMSMTVTCDLDVDLATTVGNHSVCDTNTDMTMDMKKIMPAEMLKDNPNAASSLPTITMTQKGHMDSQTVLVP